MAVTTGMQAAVATIVAIIALTMQRMAVVFPRPGDVLRIVSVSITIGKKILIVAVKIKTVAEILLVSATIGEVTTTAVVIITGTEKWSAIATITTIITMTMEKTETIAVAAVTTGKHLATMMTAKTETVDAINIMGRCA